MLLPVFIILATVVVITSIIPVAYGKTHIKIHFRNVPLAETALIGGGK
jgi:hypothetical protein